MRKPATKRVPDGKREGFAFLLSPAVEHLRTALDTAPSVSLAALADTYYHPNPADFSRIKLHKKLRTNDEAKFWLLRKAAEDIAAGLDIGPDTVALKPGVTPDDLRYDGERIIPMGLDGNHHLKSPFDPMLQTGTFAGNVRAGGKDDLGELRESMQHFGWLDHHPAILDEHGVVITGHRRLAIAKELGIEPKTVTIAFGYGDPGDAERLRYALASNLGGKPLNAADRKRIAERLYGTGEWTIMQIAAVLGTARENVRRDLDDFTHMGKPKSSQEKNKGGRPKGSGTRRPSKVEIPVEIAVARKVLDEGKTLRQAAQEAGAGTEQVAKIAVAREEGRREERAKQAATPAPAPLPTYSLLEQVEALFDQLDDEGQREFCERRCSCPKD